MQLAEALLEALHRAGAREIFGIPGDFALPYFEVIERSGVMPLYTLSHEPAVGFAADAGTRFRGGLLGNLPAGQLRPEIDAAAKKLEPGDLSPVLETDDGALGVRTVVEGVVDFVPVRMIRDKQFAYYKNYMPYAPAGQYLAYLWKAQAAPARYTGHHEHFMGSCPDCGSGQLAYEEGCMKCHVCGYSECG